jgi:hypothetical protein
VFDIESIASRVVLSPGERAVIVEQATALSVAAGTLEGQARDGVAGDVIRTFLGMARVTKNIEDVCSIAVRRTVEAEQ